MSDRSEMAFSHHSHSGQFCAHATDTLKEVVEEAIRKRMTVFALTEHMPRESIDLYREELELGYTSEKLSTIFDNYYYEARRLQQEYGLHIKILVGMEIDWIRGSSYEWIEALLAKYPMDLFIGSVHHVHDIPIDYDRETYENARRLSGGQDEDLFKAYFDAQYEMLQRLKPPIIGHFDLIRLKSDDPDVDLTSLVHVWPKIERNLDFIAGYGGVVELNSAALRKGMTEPYPQKAVCHACTQCSASFVFETDSERRLS